MNTSNNKPDDDSKSNAGLEYQVAIFTDSVRLKEKFQTLSNESTVFKAMIKPYNEITAATNFDFLDTAIFELRISTTFEDIELIRTLHRLRPLLPILTISINDNQEVKVMALRAGSTEFVASATPIDELICRVEGLCGIGRASRLVEIQNSELIQSMNLLQKAEEEKERSKATLVQTAKMASLGELAGNVAHEINNPLTVLNGRIHQLKKLLEAETPDKIKAIGLVEALSTTSWRIAKIVRGLKSASRDGSEDPFELAVLETIVEDTLSFCAEGIRHLEIDLKILPFSNAIKILCRPTQISQVILNLLGNSRDAVEGTKSPWITLEAQEDNQNLKLIIKDSGKGIPPEVVRKIFEPFFTTKPVNKGTGLGLPICKKIIEEHKGTLEIDSSAPNTTFVVTLPKSK